MKRFVRSAACLFASLAVAGVAPARDAAPSAPGFLVAAPDRGFTGNEEVRDAFAGFAAGRNAELVFITDARSEPALGRALSTLRQRGAAQMVVLPAFLSDAEPRRRLLSEQLARLGHADPGLPPIRIAPPFGASYLAVEALADRLRAAAKTGATRFLVVGQGAPDDAQRRAMTADLQRLTRTAADLPGTEVAVHIWADRDPGDNEADSKTPSQALATALAERPGSVVVPLHLGRKLDRMMAFDNELRAALPAGTPFAEGDALAPTSFGQWLGQSANRYLPLADRDIGVVVLAHGADWHWNQSVREAVQPLEARYRIEYTFSMADQATIDRAVQRLQARGARAVVVVRVFGLAESFRAGIERMLGMDIDAGQPTGASIASSHNDHHGHDMGAPEPRIRASIPMTSVGGLEDHPLFAEALLARARALSTNPGRETLILVGHGAGDDAADAHWNALLQSLAAQMRAQGGSDFRAIRTSTWREDWPDRRQAAVARVRAWVTKAQTDGGAALVIPARSNGQGPENHLLKGLKFRLGEGFAPHPLFRQWIAEQIEQGIAKLQHTSDSEIVSPVPASGGDRHP